MKLYFLPLACSLASRIALYEAGAQACFVQVDSRTKRTNDGQDFRTITSLALVPTLETDAGEILSENAAVLQYLARAYPAARLAPEDALGTARLQQWLCFIGTELHKSVYVPLLDPHAHEEVRAYALRNVELRFDWLQEQLAGRRFLLDEFSIADAYLFAVLNWSMVVPVPLERWPAVKAYHRGLAERPSVARAFAEELELYREELAAHAAQ
ncbi:MAG TPA: glutathione binding-like protein [Polyangiaceae bacterium]|nr:glutathione binding-like protein [Polyangiaceae bacterium]